MGAVQTGRPTNGVCLVAGARDQNPRPALAGDTQWEGLDPAYPPRVAPTPRLAPSSTAVLSTSGRSVRGDVFSGGARVPSGWTAAAAAAVAAARGRASRQARSAHGAGDRPARRRRATAPPPGRCVGQPSASCGTLLALPSPGCGATVQEGPPPSAPAVQHSAACLHTTHTSYLADPLLHYKRPSLSSRAVLPLLTKTPHLSAHSNSAPFYPRS